MAEHLILRLEAPLQAWGDVAMDPRRPTRAFPSRSALAGLIANALGWRQRDADQTTALQDALRYAVRENRQPRYLQDYQTADLDRETTGWTRWGVESRKPGLGTQLLDKHYLADGCFQVALTLAGGRVALPDTSIITVDDVEQALRRPARPLFLGRKSCPPAAPLLARAGECRMTAATPIEALLALPLPEATEPLRRVAPESVRLWYDPQDGAPRDFDAPSDVQEVWDRRDFRTSRFGGSRRVALVVVRRAEFPATREVV